MKAFIFAAGRGTRLRPFTHDKPKALVKIEGTPLLEILLRRLEDEGFRHIVINVHHFADQILDFISRRRKHSKAALFASDERDFLLDTGGGLYAARELIGPHDSFLAHNVDILSDIPLAQFLKAHEKSGALATLAVKDRYTQRKLIFDLKGQLCGRRKSADEITLIHPDSGPFQELGFCGIHALSPKWFELTNERGAFGIISNYLRLAAANELIQAWNANNYRWKDVGCPEHLSPL